MIGILTECSVVVTKETVEINTNFQRINLLVQNLHAFLVFIIVEQSFGFGNADINAVRLNTLFGHSQWNDGFTVDSSRYRSNTTTTTFSIFFKRILMMMNVRITRQTRMNRIGRCRLQILKNSWVKRDWWKYYLNILGREAHFTCLQVTGYYDDWCLLQAAPETLTIDVQICPRHRDLFLSFPLVDEWTALCYSSVRLWAFVPHLQTKINGIDMLLHLHTFIVRKNIFREDKLEMLSLVLFEIGVGRRGRGWGLKIARNQFCALQIMFAPRPKPS